MSAPYASYQHQAIFTCHRAKCYYCMEDLERKDALQHLEEDHTNDARDATKWIRTLEHAYVRKTGAVLAERIRCAEGSKAIHKACLEVDCCAEGQDIEDFILSGKEQP